MLFPLLTQHPLPSSLEHWTNMSIAATTRKQNSAKVLLTRQRWLAGHLTTPSILIMPRMLCDLLLSFSCFRFLRFLIYILTLYYIYIYRYKHYLRPEDERLAKNIWDLIQQNNDPTNAPYHFTVRCSAGGEECPDGRYVWSLFVSSPPCS